ncbi:MAG: putative DNA binding domain-containing protein [Desulfobacula sp.]|nr:putative DNA binding domain-containing protein [Desulfobacula sp.]
MEDNGYIRKLVNEKEGKQMAFFEAINIVKIAETVCAYLNTMGGRILVGIDQKKNSINLSDFENQFSQLRKFIFDNVKPESIINVRKEKYEGNDIIQIDVIQGNSQPYSLKNKIFVRNGKETVPAKPEDVGILIRNRKKDEYHWERLTIPEVEIGELDSKEISNTVQISNDVGRTTSFNEDDQFSFLQHFNLIKNQCFTNASVLLFAKEPVKYIPQCRVRVIEMPLGKTGSKYETALVLETNLILAFYELQKYFKLKLPLIHEFSNEDWLRKDRPKFPLEALDEAVINALIHRDFSDVTGEVLINVYKEKIEISNSGILPYTDSELKKSHLSIPPNPDIAHIFYLRGMIEKAGRGTVLIKERFEDLKLKSPKWVSKANHVVLTLYSRQEEIVLNDRQLIFLKSIKEGDVFSREDYQAFFEDGIVDKTARLHISKLVDGGWLKKTGEGPATKYIRTNKKLPNVTG